MYTKILLTIALFLPVFSTITTASFVISQTSHVNAPATGTRIGHEEQSTMDNNLLGNVLFPQTDINHMPHGEEDGKPHVFHFQNLGANCRRKTILCIIIAKALLAMLHLAALAAGFYQLMH